MPNRSFSAPRAALAGGALLALLAASAVLTSPDAASGSSPRLAAATAPAQAPEKEAPTPADDVGTSVPAAAGVRFPDVEAGVAPTF